MVIVVVLLLGKLILFKEPDGSIHYNGAFNKRATSRYNFDTKEWTDNKNPICWHGGLFEYKDNILTDGKNVLV